MKYTNYSDLAGHIVQRLMPYGIEVTTGFDPTGFKVAINATKSFTLSSTDYMGLLMNPQAFEERVRSELGMLHTSKILIQRVGRINTDYWASSPNARRRK
jgi:hypothetical protein